MSCVKHLRAAVVGCLLLSSFGSHSAFADGGDIAWSDPSAASSVAFKAGKVFALRGDVSSEFAQAVIRAHHARSGRLLWQQSITAPGDVFANQVTASRNLVIVVGGASDGTSFDWFAAAFNPRTGRPLWRTTVPDNREGFANAVSIIGNRVVIAGTELGENFSPAAFVVRALDARTGRLLWEDEDPRVGQSFANIVARTSIRLPDDDDADDDSGDSDDDPDDDDSDYDLEVAIVYGDIQGSDNDKDPLIRAYDAVTGRTLWSSTIDNGGADETPFDSLAVANGVAYAGLSYYSPDGVPSTTS